MMHGMDIWPSQAVGPEAAGRARILDLALEIHLLFSSDKLRFFPATTSYPQCIAK